MKKILCVILLLLLLFTMSFTASAEVSNSADLTSVSYTYDQDARPYVIPSLYTYTESIDGVSIGVGAFKDISDLYYDADSELTAICDTGNKRVLILDKDYQVVRIIDKFNNKNAEDALEQPSSAVILNGKLYISDMSKSRILLFDMENYALEKVFTKPKINALGENYEYLPYKIAVDEAEHIYVVAQNITEGIILLDKDGGFISFFGAPKVKTSSLQELAKRFMTKKQREKLYKSIPTEYSSIMIDSTGFVGLATQSTEANPISRMNHTSVNIFESKQNIPKGDEVYTITYFSTFVDVAEDSFGNYLALDNFKGRVFIYTKDGDMLGCFGGLGTQKGTFESVTALEAIGDKIAVADTRRNTIEIFDYTEFGESVFVGYYEINKGNYLESKPYFEKALSMCQGYIPAHLNLGRIAYWEGDNKTAATEFYFAKNLDYYSLAYKGIIADFLDENFIFLVLILLVAIVAIAVYFYYKKKHPKQKLDKYNVDVSTFRKKWKYVNRCCLHPFDGFWCVRRENCGSLLVANLLMVSFIAIYTINAKFCAPLFSVGQSGDPALKTFGVLIPIILWVICNGAISIFFDGKARMRDLYIVTCYSLKPIIIASLLLIPITYFLTIDENFVYQIIITFGWVWSLGLMFLGMITVQDFSLSKGILASIFTLLGMALIVFIALVVINMSQDILTYFTDIFKEISYRT